MAIVTTVACDTTESGEQGATTDTDAATSGAPPSEDPSSTSGAMSTGGEESTAAGESSTGDASTGGALGDCPAGDAAGVHAVLGLADDGQTLVVCGGGFGDLGPDIVLFDDMEGQDTDSAVLDATQPIGAWISGSSTYVDDAARSGRMAMLAADNSGEDNGRSTVFGIPDESAALGLREFDELFVSWALMDLGDFPGNNSSPTSFSSDSSAKDIWLMYGDRGDNYDYSCSTGECNGHDVVLGTHTGQGSFAIGGNTSAGQWWLPDYWQFQAWNAMSTWMRLDRSDPYGAIEGVFEHVSPSGYVRSEYDEPMLETLDGIPPAWDRLKFGAWYRDAGDIRRVFDDVYIAVGPGAAARVELANAADITQATKRSICTVDSWSDGRIELTVHTGDLDLGNETLYLFVVDAENQRSAGFAL